MKKYIIGIIACLLTISINAQEVNNELEVHKINGKEYYIHVVEPGNTLYAISRKYAVPVEVLKTENPRLSQELTIGDRLLIPVKEVIRKDLSEGLEIDGNFLIHEVQRKNTLYSIAKEYNVEINEIIAVNPEIEEGLKKGMKIKIPVAKIKSKPENAKYIVPASTNPYVTHLVLAKETLYSLSKFYNVTVDSILEVNNGLIEGLKVGQLINIPIIKTYEDTSVVKVEFDSTAVKERYKVALLMPLYLDLLNSVQDTSYKESEAIFKDLFNKSKYGIEFYQGFKIAVDSLLKMGLNLKLEVIDTKNDLEHVKKLLASGRLNELDLIIGPLYLDEFMLVADFAKKHKINIVSPVKQSNKILLGNNYVSKVATSEPVRLKFLGQYMADSLKHDNLFLVYPDHFSERKRVENIQKYFIKTIEQTGDSVRVSFPKEVLWNPSMFFAVKSRLVKDKQNTIVIPSDDQAFITQFLTMMSPLHDEYKIKIIGLESWQNFDNIEVEYLHHLNINLVVSEFIDYGSPAVKAFDKKFYEQYQFLPEKFSYLGYDVGMYYLKLLNDFGLNFEVMFLGIQDQLLSRKFEFFKTGIESGYENHSVFLVHYKDYSLQLKNK
ncbi:MAG: LysM peptidoglycan-binding domain-containing protein [Bacteroidetes bacterium]|nr:LysM peptidoglycan-binding domain-containing protein [Bacteroidota bacterium]